MSNSVLITVEQNVYVTQILRVLSDHRLKALYSPEQYDMNGVHEKYHVLTKELKGSILVFTGHIDNYDLQHEKYFLSKEGSQTFLNFEGDPSNYSKVHDFFISDLKRMLRSANEVQKRLGKKQGGGAVPAFPGIYLKRGNIGKIGKANFKSLIEAGVIQTSFFEICKASYLTMYRSKGRKKS